MAPYFLHDIDIRYMVLHYRLRREREVKMSIDLDCDPYVPESSVIVTHARNGKITSGDVGLYLHPLQKLQEAPAGIHLQEELLKGNVPTANACLLDFFLQQNTQQDRSALLQIFIGQGHLDPSYWSTVNANIPLPDYSVVFWGTVYSDKKTGGEKFVRRLRLIQLPKGRFDLMEEKTVLTSGNHSWGPYLPAVIINNQ